MPQRIAISLSLLILTISLSAQIPYTLKANKITVAGTSTLHDWVSDVTKVDWNGSFSIEGNSITEVSNVKVVIPVKAIVSTKGKMMDNKTWEAFDYEKNPNITYQLTKATIKGDEIQASGTLTMAGASKAIQFVVKTKHLANGDIQLSGSYTLNMKDYKMEPPTAMMGTIKVGEEITVGFDLTLTTDKELTNSN